MCVEDCSVNYEKLENRLHSFRNWRGFTDPFEMALDGFYFTGTDDACVCFYCDIEIFKWEPNDKPLDEHLRFSPNCHFALSMKKVGEQLKQDNEKLFRSILPCISENCVEKMKEEIFDKVFRNISHCNGKRAMRSSHWNWFPTVSVTLLIFISYFVSINFFKVL